VRLDDCGDVLGVEELRQVLHIGLRQAYELLRRGDIYSVRIGRSRRIPRAAVVRFLAGADEPKPPQLVAVEGHGSR